MKITIKELIQKLKKFDSDSIVVVNNYDFDMILDFPRVIKKITLKQGEYENSYDKDKSGKIKAVIIE